MAETKMVRVATTHPSASETISGVLFCTHSIDGQRGRVSERIPEDLAKSHFLCSPMFRLFDVSGKDDAALEKALEKARASRPGIQAAEQAAEGTIRELQEANRMLRAQRDSLRTRIEELEAQLAGRTAPVAETYAAEPDDDFEPQPAARSESAAV